MPINHLSIVGCVVCISGNLSRLTIAFFVCRVLTKDFLGRSDTLQIPLCDPDCCASGWYALPFFTAVLHSVRHSVTQCFKLCAYLCGTLWLTVFYSVVALPFFTTVLHSVARSFYSVVLCDFLCATLGCSSLTIGFFVCRVSGPIPPAPDITHVIH